jgi:hypothetical protein
MRVKVLHEGYNPEPEEKDSIVSFTIDKELQQNKREAAFGALVDEGLLAHYGLLCDPLFKHSSDIALRFLCFC